MGRARGAGAERERASGGARAWGRGARRRGMRGGSRVGVRLSVRLTIDADRDMSPSLMTAGSAGHRGVRPVIGAVSAARSSVPRSQYGPIRLLAHPLGRRWVPHTTGRLAAVRNGGSVRAQRRLGPCAAAARSVRSGGSVRAQRRLGPCATAARSVRNGGSVRAKWRLGPCGPATKPRNGRVPPYASSRSTTTRDAGSRTGPGTSLTFGTKEAARAVAVTIS